MVFKLFVVSFWKQFVDQWFKPIDFFFISLNLAILRKDTFQTVINSLIALSLCLPLAFCYVKLHNESIYPFLYSVSIPFYPDSL